MQGSYFISTRLFFASGSAAIFFHRQIKPQEPQDPIRNGRDEEGTWGRGRGGGGGGEGGGGGGGGGGVRGGRGHFAFGRK